MSFLAVARRAYPQTVDIGQGVFDALLESRDTVVVKAGLDGCWLNSHVACKIIAGFGIRPDEMIVRPFGDGSFSADLSAAENRRDISTPSWRYHMAAVLPAKNPEEAVVIDPFLFTRPVPLPRFLAVFPADACREMRVSPHSTFAETVYGKRSMEEFLNIITLRHRFNIAHIKLNQRYIDCPVSIDKTRIGPTLGDFIHSRPSTGLHLT